MTAAYPDLANPYTLWVAAYDLLGTRTWRLAQGRHVTILCSLRPGGEGVCWTCVMRSSMAGGQTVRYPPSSAPPSSPFR